MNLKHTIVAAVILMASGCAQDDAVKPPSEPDFRSSIGGTTSTSSSSTAMTSSGTLGNRTRADTYAEGVEAMRN